MTPVVFITLLVLMNSLTSGRDWYAQPGDMLQEIINQTSDGDRIIIPKGKYQGTIIINREIEITGEDFPLIHGQNIGDVVIITADNVILNGLEIQWSGTRLLEDEAGIKIEGNKVVVNNCRIINTLHGIYVKGGKEITLLNNTIYGRSDLIPALRGNGIHLWNTKNNLVKGNEIRETRDGIYFSFADETRVIDNHIHRLRYGLHYMYSDDNYFYNNLFEYNVAGAALMYSNRIHFEKNVFSHNRGYYSYGVLYQSCDFCTAKDNLIIDNTRGIYFEASNFNEVWNNDFVENDIAVHISASSEENKLFKNNFLENLSELTVDAKGYPNYWSDEGQGNYWTNYHGYDLDRNSIGDYPHKLQNVFEYLEVDYPEVRLYLYSPAAQVLEIAERTFPILQAASKKDPFPLMEPIPNEKIPWDNFIQGPRQVSYAYIILFGALTLSPLALITRYWR